MECYQLNRTRVFEIYGLDPKDKKYNCHHIVTREDLKLGLVSSDFDLNTKSNLYPSVVKDHDNLHVRLNRLEPRPKPQLKPVEEPKIVNDNIQRVWLTPIVSFLFDPKILQSINSPVVREKSSQLRFLVWHRQGIL